MKKLSILFLTLTLCGGSQVAIGMERNTHFEQEKKLREHYCKIPATQRRPWLNTLSLANQDLLLKPLLAHNFQHTAPISESMARTSEQHQENPSDRRRVRRAQLREVTQRIKSAQPPDLKNNTARYAPPSTSPLPEHHAIYRKDESIFHPGLGARFVLSRKPIDIVFPTIRALRNQLQTF